MRLGKGISPHTARKSYAVSLLKAKGGDIEAVQAKLGHKYLSTTMLYALADKMS